MDEIKKRLQDEIKTLEYELRVELPKEILKAREHGDLRENADYDAAKNDQGLMEARIRQLTALLENAETRLPEASDTVEVGSVVTVVDSDGDELQYFVAPQENRVPGLILASPTSPVGAALLGASVGQEVTYEAPGGTFSMTVTAVAPYEG